MGLGFLPLGPHTMQPYRAEEAALPVKELPLRHGGMFPDPWCLLVGPRPYTQQVSERAQSIREHPSACQLICSSLRLVRRLGVSSSGVTFLTKATTHSNK